VTKGFSPRSVDDLRVKRRAFALRDRCAAPDLSHPVKHNHTSIVQDAYLTGLRDAMHIAEQATTKSDILEALRARIEQCGPANPSETPNGSNGKPALAPAEGCA
jgi:hypothetical protein